MKHEILLPPAEGLCPRWESQRVKAFIKGAALNERHRGCCYVIRLENGELEIKQRAVPLSVPLSRIHEHGR